LNIFPSSPLGRKLLYAILLFSGVFALISSFLLICHDYKQNIKQLNARFDIVQKSYLPALGNSVWDFDDQLINHQLNGIIHLPDIQYARLQSNLGTTWYAGELSLTYQEKKQFELFHDDEQVATLTVIANMGSIYSDLVSKAILILLMQLTQTVLIGLVIYWLVNQLITRHVVKITDFAERQNFSAPIDTLSLDRNRSCNDEIDRLVQTLNTMQQRFRRDLLTIEQQQTKLYNNIAQLKNAEQLAQLGWWRLDPTDNTVFWSKEWHKILSMSAKATASHQAFMDLIIDEDAEQMSVAFDTLFQQHQSFNLEHRVRLATGEEIWLHHVAQVSHHEDGYFFIGTIQDITLRKRNNQQLELVLRVFENMNEAVLITDGQQKIVKINRAFTDITGYELSDLHGSTPSILNSGRQNAEFYEKMWASIQEQGHWHGEMWNRRKNGEVFPEWLKIATICDENNKVLYYYSIFSDISEKKRTQELMRFQANFDHLTGLPNRTLVFERLTNSVKLAKRANQEMAVLYIDLDMFKLINDSKGHLVGDELIKQVADRFKSVIRSSDILARVGGDEFVIIANAITPEYSAELVADKLQAVLKVPFMIGNERLHTSSSLGIALYPFDGIEAGTLLLKSEQAMYQAKELGRQKSHFYTDTMQQAAKRRQLVKEAMLYGLEQDEFYVQLQPIVCVASNKVTKYESLARWNSKTLGQVAPIEFIAAAEYFGLIDKVGFLVAQKALIAIEQINTATHQVAQVAINRSIKEFSSTQVMPLSELIKQSNVPPSWVILELTESVLIIEQLTNNHEIFLLRDMGVKIAIDDFGTGYSSLSYLSKFPVDMLKIDRSFIANIETDPSARRLIDTILKLAEGLDLETVIEGIETQAQLDFISELGATYYQGYYFSKPKRVATLLEEITRSVSD